MPNFGNHSVHVFCMRCNIFSISVHVGSLLDVNGILGEGLKLELLG